MNDPLKLFLVIPATAVSKVNLSETLELTQDNLKYSLDKTKTYISWWSDKAPSSLKNLVTEKIEGPYYEQAIEGIGLNTWN